MRRMLTVLAMASVAFAQNVDQRGRAEEQRACVPCHSLRLIDSQRLSAAAWGKELDKMERWGAVIQDRQALLDYLSKEYPDTKPVPPPKRTGDGAKSAAQAH